MIVGALARRGSGKGAKETTRFLTGFETAVALAGLVQGNAPSDSLVVIHIIDK